MLKPNPHFFSFLSFFFAAHKYRVEWPGKENQAAQPKGYVYIIFESEKQVRELLCACTISEGNDANAGNYYYKISSKRIKAKEVIKERQFICMQRSSEEQGYILFVRSIRFVSDTQPEIQFYE